MATDPSALRTAAVAAVATCAVVAVDMTSALAVVAVVVAVLWSSSFVVHAWRHRALAATLRRTSTPTRCAGIAVRMAPLPTTAFVAGITRPEIFFGHDLRDELSPEELRAVTLHERAHQVSRDPLRATMVAAVAPALRLTARGRRWLESVAAGREIAADRYALGHGVRRSALASALLTVQPMSMAHATAFAPAVDVRLRALLDDQVPPPSRRRVGWLAGGIAAGLAACAATLHPLHPVLAALCC